MGVDVFGRGTFGGGEWHTNVGVAHARNAGLSVALFAAGWYYENCEKGQLPQLAQRFWQSIQGSYVASSLRAALPIAWLPTCFQRVSGYLYGVNSALRQGGLCATVAVLRDRLVLSFLPYPRPAVM